MILSRKERIKIDRVDLGTIRRASIGAVFDILSNGESVSRAKLASMSGLSLVTVGKAVELLEKAGAVVQQKEVSRAAGRRSSLCCLDRGRSMMIYDFSDARRLCTVDILTNITGNYSLDGADREEFAQISAQAFFSAASGGELIGRGLILPDGCTSDAGFERQNGGSADISESSVRVCALASAKAGERSSVYFRLDPDLRLTSCAIISDNRLCRGSTGCAGDVSGFLGVELIDAARAVCRLVDPEVMRFETPDGAERGRLAESLCGCGLSAEVDVVVSDHTRAVKGMAKLLISKWLDELCGG